MKKLALLFINIIFISLILTNVSYAKIDVEDIIGMWLFDEGKGDVAQDTSGNDYNGELINEPEWVEGNFGQALKYDGSNSYVNAGTVPLSSNSVTVSAWLYTDTPSPGWTHVVENGVIENVWNGAYRLEFGPEEGQFYIAIGDGAAYKDNDPNGVNIGWKYEEWFHVVFTYDGSQGTTYLNGTEVDSFESNLDISSGTGTLIFGSMQGADRFYNGILDEVVIFDVSLTEDNIESLNKGMSSVLAVSPSDKLATTWSSIKK